MRPTRIHVQAGAPPLPDTSHSWMQIDPEARDSISIACHIFDIMIITIPMYTAPTLVIPEDVDGTSVDGVGGIGVIVTNGVDLEGPATGDSVVYSRGSSRDGDGGLT